VEAEAWGITYRISGQSPAESVRKERPDTPTAAPADTARHRRPIHWARRIPRFQDKTKARPLSEPSLHFNSRGRLSPSRCLKRLHSTAAPTPCLLGKDLVLVSSLLGSWLPLRSRSTGGLIPSRGKGATSGFVDMLGSRLGGFMEPRGSPRLSGVCWIPGFIRDGRIAGTPDSNGLSGVRPGAGPPPLSGNWAGGSTSAAMTNGGRRVKMAMATVEEPSRTTS
jgi:hypothetical protein